MVKPTAPIRALDGRIGRYHREETFEGFGQTRILLAAAQERYQTRMEEFAAERRELVHQFVSAYPEHLAHEKKVHGDRYQATDYPLQSVVGTKFSFTFGFEPLAPPNSFQSDLLAADTISRIQRDHQQQLSAAVANIENESIERGLDLLKTLATELSKPKVKIYDEDGRQGIVPRLREFLERIPERNLTNNPVLEGLRREIDEKLVLATDLLRKSPLARAETVHAARAILAQFKGPGARRISLPVEDVPEAASA